MSYVVTVHFRAKAEHRAAFRAAMNENATASRETEPGCRQFDVCESTDGADIFLYEVYDDEAAFQAHLATAHYQRFNATVTPWLERKEVSKLRLISPTPHAPRLTP